MEHIAGIDTSEGMELSCLVIGKCYAIDTLHSNMFSIFKQYANFNLKKIGWSYFRQDIRNKAKNEVISCINKSKNISFHITSHKLPMNDIPRLFYLRDVPKHLSTKFDVIRGRGGILTIETDDDWRVKSVGASSNRFLEQLIREIGQVLNPNYKGLKINLRGGKLHTTIEQADAVLGYGRNYKNELDKKVVFSLI